jgi:hypothetical protein
MFYTMYLDGECQLLLLVPSNVSSSIPVKPAPLPRVDGGRFPMSSLTAAHMARI